MATSRALVCLFRRRILLSSNVPITSILTNNITSPYVNYLQYSPYSDQKSLSKLEQTESKSGQVQIGLAEAVKENTKSAWYMAVIAVGITGTAALFYTIFKELFSSKSPNGVYNMACKRCLKEPRIVRELGAPIKVYGEETRRGRRSRVNHMIYKGEDGVNRMRMNFYMEGSDKQGTVHLEMRENLSGNWSYRYMFIQLKDLSKTVIVLEDNREFENLIFSKPEDAHEIMP